MLKGRLHRLFTCQNATLLEIKCHISFYEFCHPPAHILPLIALTKFSSFVIASVAEQASLSLTWLQIIETWLSRPDITEKLLTGM